MANNRTASARSNAVLADLMSSPCITNNAIRSAVMRGERQLLWDSAHGSRRDFCDGEGFGSPRNRKATGPAAHINAMASKGRVCEPPRPGNPASITTTVKEGGRRRRDRRRRGAWHGSAWPARYYPAYPRATAAAQPDRTVLVAASLAPPGRPAAA